MIEINNLTKYYKDLKTLDIDHLVFATGRSYGIVGQNGAGKTTLLKCITNIICDYSGTVKISDVNVKERNEILSKVGITLDGTSVYRDRTGQFNIDYFCGLRGKKNEELLDKLVYSLELTDYLQKKVKYYSYGMEKKLILLISLLAEPEVLILDEPFRGLDVSTVGLLNKHILDLKKNGTTIIISSHIQKDIEKLCEEVYFIEKGIIKEHIDLIDEKKKLLRIVNSTNNERLQELLMETAIIFTVTDQNKLKLNIGSTEWRKITEKLQREEIDILEMTQVSALEGKMN